MTYAQFKNGIIREMQKEDAAIIHAENLSHGWYSDQKTYEQYFSRQNSGTLFVFAAEYEGNFAGYATLRPQAVTGPLCNKGIPEVADRNVFLKYRNRGRISPRPTR